METTGKIKLFSDSDLDGISCGILAKFVFGEERVDTMFCTPKDINQRLMSFIEKEEYNKYDKVFITDLVIKPETAAKIDSIPGFKFKLFDHHKSNYTNSKYTWVTVSENFVGRKTCGTELFYNHLLEYYIEVRNDYIEKYVEYVRLWDTWEWPSAGADGIYAKKLNTLLSMYSNTKYMNSIIIPLENNSTTFISDSDEEILKVEENRKNRYIKQKSRNIRVMEVSGHKLGFVFAENYISELCNYMLKNIEGVEIAAAINADAHVVSLRTTEATGIDVSEFAKTFTPQGGGHPLSAGFVFNTEYETKFVQDIFQTYSKE